MLQFSKESSFLLRLSIEVGSRERSPMDTNTIFKKIHRVSPHGMKNTCVFVCMCLVASVVSSSCDPMDCSPPGSSVHKISRQEYWSGLPFPLPGDLPDPGIEPRSLTSPALAGGFTTTSATWEVFLYTHSFEFFAPSYHIEVAVSCRAIIWPSYNMELYHFFDFSCGGKENMTGRRDHI